MDRFMDTSIKLDTDQRHFLNILLHRQTKINWNK